MSDRQRIGSSFDHYRIVSKLGSGGMGEVYLAEDTKLDRRVALKILLAEIANDETRVRRFIQEAKAASALNHPNILTVHEIGSFEGSQYIVTEYIKGETLRDRLNDGPTTLRETLDLTMQIAAALSAAHDAGIVHRDIKPENIMIRDDGIAKVLDFGLVKLTEKEKKVSDSKDATRVKTDPGMVMGTASYMSPEQARGKETDARTDVWSLGIVLYEMLSGETPFAGETANDSIAAILTKDPVPLAPELPHDLHKFVRRALQKRPDDRYQTIKDLLLDIQDLKREREVSEEIERSHIPSASRSTNVGITQSDENVTAMHPGAISTQDSIAHQPSSAEYIVSEISQHKRGVLGVLGVLLITLVCALGYFYWVASPASAAITSVAVLPFENGSGDPNLDYLSDGLSETLIDKLSELPQLKVIARNSSFKYRGSGLDLQAVANKLGVRAIVTGKVVRVGDNVNVRVEMVDATENRQLWSQQYNRKASDLISIQQEIAQTASDKLRLKLSGSQEQQLSKPGTADPRAYELLLKGRYYFAKGGTDNIKSSIEHFEQAVAADPNYALAHAELSLKYYILAGQSVVDPKVYLPKADSAARKALSLDDNLAEAHLAISRIYVARWQWQEGEAERKRAIELDASNALAHDLYAQLLAILGRHDESVSEAMRAKDLDPLSPLVAGNLGFRLYFARRYDESIAALKKGLELNPDFDLTYNILGYAYAGKGQFREAIDAYQEAVRLGDESTSVQVYLGAAYARAGELGKAQQILKQLQTTKEYVSPGELAALHAALDDKEAAFTSLNKAYEDHDLQLQFLKVDPSYDPLRSDPRFADLIRRVGLPQ